MVEADDAHPGAAPTRKLHLAALRAFVDCLATRHVVVLNPAGRRLEADFGHVHVDFPDGRRLVPVLVVTWSYSNDPFALALPTERTEAVLHGLCEAFDFFGRVPWEVWWDILRAGRGG